MSLAILERLAALAEDAVKAQLVPEFGGATRARGNSALLQASGTLTPAEGAGRWGYAAPLRVLRQAARSRHDDARVGP